MKDHPLHKLIGDEVSKVSDPDRKITVVLDPACGGSNNIPLFASEDKANSTEYCDVDILIIKDDKIKVIIEIEEANVKPTQVCGKLLTSALSKCYIHKQFNNKPIWMDESVSFIQVLDITKLKENSSKPEQWDSLAVSIQSVLPLKKSNIKNYKLFYEKKDFPKIGDEIITLLQT
jgi:hypothetical protein